jgi:hypothetical protein
MAPTASSVETAAATAVEAAAAPMEATKTGLSAEGIASRHPAMIEAATVDD